jgi:hypothetical protein
MAKAFSAAIIILPTGLMKNNHEVIDIHAHFTPPAWIEEVRRNGIDPGGFG